MQALYRWVDRDDMEFNDEFEAEDEERDDEADRFEAKFNFRFEEQDANQVTSKFVIFLNYLTDTTRNIFCLQLMDVRLKDHCVRKIVREQISVKNVKNVRKNKESNWKKKSSRSSLLPRVLFSIVFRKLK